MKSIRNSLFVIMMMSFFLIISACGGGGTPGSSSKDPVADAGLDQTGKVGDQITLNGSGSSDPGGSIASFAWIQTLGEPVTLSGASSATPTFEIPVVDPLGDSLTFSLTVTDNDNNTSTDTVVVDVLPATFSDDFSVDTSGSYAWTNTWTVGGTPSHSYDGIGKRVQVVTGDDQGIQFAKSLTASNSGTFVVDFLPTLSHPSHGGIWIRLRQNQTTYYEIANFDGADSTPKELKKWVNGVKVDSVAIPSLYSQNTTYTIKVTFSPTSAKLTAFGSTITINTDSTPILVSSFEIETKQQDAYYDNILFY
jgi:hypothetical protein